MNLGDRLIEAMGCYGGVNEGFIPAPNPDSYYGTYAAVRLTDGVDVLVRMTIRAPYSIVSVGTAVALVIPAGTGNLRRSVATNFSTCAEDYQTHTDSIAAGEEAVTTDEIECLDISDALTGLAAGDFVGVEFTRHGSHANDTVNADCYFLGILVMRA